MVLYRLTERGRLLLAALASDAVPA